MLLQPQLGEMGGFQELLADFWCLLIQFTI